MTTVPVARIINLDRSVDRLTTITAKLDSQGIDWQRHPAIAPASPEAAHAHPLYRPQRMRALFGRDMSRGEIGCFLSHMAVMEAALQEGAALALVLEDDATPQTTKLRETLATLSDWLCQTGQARVDWVHLSRPLGKWGRPLATVGDIQVRRAYRPPLIGSANLWTRKGMQDFLHHVARYGMDRPADDAMRACFCRSGRGAVLEQPLFGEEGSVSTIDPQNERTSGANKLVRMRRKGPDYAWATLNLLRKT
ncbi:glycosyltransferase family 25 protein [Pseudotabrizicola formosa]|uniref:glycosyltransferase family 25 protein n=1 Tax=Pseudotabrizicola formosa TaxID=2030009 RepID=UPI000CD284B7|nr:glycosyltransferase family 25 protein [Pseudotabrizicola formosa]